MAMQQSSSSRRMRLWPHLRTQTPRESLMYEPTSNVPYVPIEQDALFQLDTPMADEYVLYLPKEGEALVECQDRFALDTVGRCYAIADGVSGSFVPGPWARIVARGFVEYVSETLREAPGGHYERVSSRAEQCFGDSTHFEQWLQQCRHAWYRWMRERWVPTINAMRVHHGNSAMNWDIEIEQGAQTTLTGCWLRPRTDPLDAYIDVFVSIIGDSEFFLFRRDEQGEWQNIVALPFISVDEFEIRPTVLATRPQAELVERAWMRRQEGCVPALPGDRIILATDTLAKWLLSQVQHQEKAWTLLLDSTDSSLHERLLRHELHENRMEDDDLTMLVIPVHSSQR